MSVTLNAKGTTVPYFTVGKNGTTYYQGVNNPYPIYPVKAGDYWTDPSTNSLHVWSADTSDWAAPKLADISFNNSTISTDQQDLILKADGLNSKIIFAGEVGPGIITASDSQDLYIDPTLGGGNNLVLVANRWPGSDGVEGQVMTTDGNGVLSFSNTGALYLPSGTSAQRPAGVEGKVRYNNDNHWFEGFNGVDWYALSGSPSAAFFELSYTKTGTLVQPPIALLTPPPPSVAGLVADYSGKWASTLILSSDNTALTKITFTDLQGLTGSLAVNSMPALTELSMPALTTINGAFSVSNMSTITVLGFPNLVRVDGLCNPSSMETIAAISFPALSTAGSFAPNTMAALSSLGIPALQTVTGDFAPNTMAALATLSCGSLTTVGGTFNPNTMAALPSLSVSSLMSVGNFTPNHMAALASLSCPSLATVNGTFNPNTMAALPTMSFPSLTSISGNLQASTMAALTSINLSSLTTLGGRIILDNMVAFTTLDLSSAVTLGADVTSGNVISITSGTAAMTTLSLSSALKKVGNGAGNISITSAVLAAGVVDNILIRLAALDGTNGTSEFSNRVVTITGTSATPSPAGLSAKSVLENRGCSVTVN